MLILLLAVKVGKITLGFAKAKLVHGLSLGHVMAMFLNKAEVFFPHGQGVKVFALSMEV
jgi:hypothetical protein